MLHEDVIFDLVVNTNADKFITWFLHDWNASDKERFSCDSGEYRIDWEHFKPGEPTSSDPKDDEKFITHQIVFNGIPYPPSKIEFNNPDGCKNEIRFKNVSNDRKMLALGYMTVLDIAVEKIHIQGIVFDEAPFDDYMLKVGKRISDIYTPAQKYIKGISPELFKKPSMHDSDEKWFEYYHRCKYESRIRYTFKEMAYERHIPYSTIRKLHVGCPICIEIKANKRNKKNKNRNN